MSTLKVDRILPTGGAPTDGGGGIIQVKTNTKTDTFTRNSSSGDFGDVSGLSLTFSPINSTSRIYVIVDLNVGGNVGQRMWYRVKKVISGGGTDYLARADAASNRPRAAVTIQPLGGNGMQYMGGVFVHVAGTTNAITYTIQGGAESSQPFILNRSNSDSNSVNVARGRSSITALEVSA